MSEIIVPAWTYRQFDAESYLDVPAESYGGWEELDIPIPLSHTALVVMHAWDFGNPDEFPGWRRAVEYIPRAERICREVFPPLLEAARASDMTLFHVVSKGAYYQGYPGYKKAVELTGSSPEPSEQIESDPVLEHLRQLRASKSFVGDHNANDVRRGFQRLDFAPEAQPLGDEGIAENSHQLFHLCKATGINHLIYIGFALNWCLLLSPGGMAEMSARGFLCSTVREATTAVENKETARTEMCKEIALWRVALAYGFVFDMQPFILGLQSSHRSET